MFDALPRILRRLTVALVLLAMAVGAPGLAWSAIQPGELYCLSAGKSAASETGGSGLDARAAFTDQNLSSLTGHETQAGEAISACCFAMCVAASAVTEPDTGAAPATATTIRAGHDSPVRPHVSGGIKRPPRTLSSHHLLRA